jgi:YVTN family beta-propeller protein
MVYVVDAVEAGRVTVIDARTGQQVGKPIPVGKYPFGIAISPDGRTAYVSNFESPSVSVIDLLTLTVSQTIKAGIGEGPRGVAITPDGRFAYVANENSEFISVIDTHSNSALSPQIPVGLATQIAISPDGGTGYVTNYASRRISTFSVQANTPGPVIPASGLRPYYVAVSPDGGSMFFSSYEPSRLYRVSTQGNIVGQPATVGEGAAGVAIVPDQPPTAAFSLMQSRVRPGVPASFDASASSDSDGTISSYAWAFGDGVSASSAAPIFTHTFAKPGTYASTLRVTDNEGCSTRFVFTGQTASCNGSPLASHTANVNVTYPGVRLACPKTARPAGCRYRLVVVSSKPPARGAHGSRKGKIEARPLTAELKAGKKKIVSFMPKPKFAARLATAGKVLVKETTTIARKHKVAYRRLRIVQ